jgi:hypothetical protein
MLPCNAHELRNEVEKGIARCLCPPSPFVLQWINTHQTPKRVALVWLCHQQRKYDIDKTRRSYQACAA